MHLKRQGQYICRTLSYHGCSFRVDEQALGEDALRVYDQASELWIRLYDQLKSGLETGALNNFKRRRPPKALRLRPKRGDRRGSGSESEDSPSLGSSDDDSDSDDSEGISLDDGGDGYSALRLPYKDNAAITMIMRYFWGKRSIQNVRLFNRSVVTGMNSLLFCVKNIYLFINIFLAFLTPRFPPALLPVAVHISEGAPRHSDLPGSRRDRQGGGNRPADHRRVQHGPAVRQLRHPARRASGPQGIWRQWWKRFSASGRCGLGPE